MSGARHLMVAGVALLIGAAPAIAEPDLAQPLARSAPRPVVTVGGFAFRSTVLSDRSKPVSAAPDGYRPKWKEHVQAILPADPRDADLARVLIDKARSLADGYYGGDTGAGGGSFAATDTAGSLHVYETVSAASPDLVCVETGASYYEAGMAHPNSDAHEQLAWSRRLHRPLTQRDVFATAPSRSLRLLALAAFDNRDAIDPSALPDGLPLDWRGASVGPAGITWTFGPYELGGYTSGGTATIGWAALARYLRPHLPFAIAAVRSAAGSPARP